MLDGVGIRPDDCEAETESDGVGSWPLAVSQNLEVLHSSSLELLVEDVPGALLLVAVNSSRMR